MLDDLRSSPPKWMSSLVLSAAVCLSACTSEYQAFCEMLVICQEAFVGTTIEDCELYLENEASEDPLEREMCRAELAEAAGANHCGTFSERDPCTLCSPRLMSRLVTFERNRCDVSPFSG